MAYIDHVITLFNTFMITCLQWKIISQKIECHKTVRLYGKHVVCRYRSA